MPRFLKYMIPMLLCIAFASVLSYLAFYSFWFSARWFHSVPVVRACDSVGEFFLLPARFVYFCAGGIPIADPLGYTFTNGTLVGTLIYSILRPLHFRERNTVV